MEQLGYCDSELAHTVVEILTKFKGRENKMMS